MLEGIQGALLEHGLDLTLYDAKPGTPGRARIFGDFLARKRFDGLIAVGLEPEDGELEMLRRVGRPLVSVVGLPGATSVVAIDDDHTARRATEHLITLGHRRIAFVGGPAGEHGANVDRQRLRGLPRDDGGCRHRRPRDACAVRRSACRAGTRPR